MGFRNYRKYAFFLVLLVCGSCIRYVPTDRNEFQDPPDYMIKFEKQESGVYIDKTTGKQWLWLKEMGIWVPYNQKK